MHSTCHCMRNQSNTQQQFLLHEIQITPQALCPPKITSEYSIYQLGKATRMCLVPIRLHGMINVDLNCLWHRVNTLTFIVKSMYGSYFPIMPFKLRLIKETLKAVAYPYMSLNWIFIRQCCLPQSGSGQLHFAFHQTVRTSVSCVSKGK
jgi:hypothetical protein